MIESVLKSKCPSCRKGAMFPYKTYNLRRMGLMHSNCQECGQNFMPEPSFYVGAMYVSYAFSVAILMTLYVGNKILGGPFTTMQVFGVAVVVVVVFAPLSYRLSRSIWAHLFIKHKKSTTNN